jgi:hypothetical protein
LPVAQIQWRWNDESGHSGPGLLSVPDASLPLSVFEPRGWLVAMVAFPMLAAACALAGVPATVDSGRRRFVAERQRELGIHIPAAVAEWYAIDGAVEHFVQGSGPIIVRLEQLGLAAGGRDLAAGRLQLASDYQGCCDWVVDLAPALPADWNVPLPGMESLIQDQAAVAAYADPPVRLSMPGEPGEIWSLAAPRFSAYVHAEAWDIAFGAYPYQDGVVAFGGELSGDSDLTLLRRDFVAGPPSYGWAGCFGAPDLVVHRFERPGQRVRAAAHPAQSEWRLAADSAENLERLVALLSEGNDALARKLHPARKR